MATVPVSAMYRAKQCIAELTVYGFAQTTVNVVFLYYMVSHPGVWLSAYAAWNCLLVVVPSLLIFVRGCVIFQECRFDRRYLFSATRFKQLFAFSAYRFGGAICSILSQQGMALIVNKLLGPARNAAMAVAGTVSSHSQTFAGSLSAAFYPAVTNACGENDYGKMRRLAFAACKLSGLFALVFALPLMVEIKEVMRLWLKNPPEGASDVCWCLLCAAVLENATSGHYMVIFSVGDIKKYQFWVAMAGLVVLPVAAVFMVAGLGLIGVGCSLLISAIMVAVVRLYFGNKVGKFSPLPWIRHLLAPFGVCSSITLAIGCLASSFAGKGFSGICLVTLAMECFFIPMAWFLVLDQYDREFLLRRCKWLRKS